MSKVEIQRELIENKIKLERNISISFYDINNKYCMENILP